MSEATDTPSRIVWLELPAEDSNRVQAFYGHVLGWECEPFGEQDPHVTDQGGGAIYGAPSQHGLLAYFGVRDIDAALAETEGNAFGLYQEGGSA